MSTLTKTRQNIYLNFMHLPFIKSINTPRAAPPLGSSFNTDRPCIWQPGFAPCSQAVCSIHLAALTIATEREKKAAYQVPHWSSQRKKSFLHCLPLIRLCPSINGPLIFNPLASPLPFSHLPIPSQSRTGGGHRPEKCETTWGKRMKLYMLSLAHNDVVVRIMNIVALL